MTTPAIDLSPLKLSCPHCQQHLECDAAYGGAEIQCPACNGPMLVPPATPALPSAGCNVATLNIDTSHPALRGFCDYYAREIEPYLRTRQQHQKTARIEAFTSGLVGSIVTALVGWWAWGKYGYDEPLVWGLVGFLVFMTIAAVWHPLDYLRRAVKGFLLLEVCNFFGFEYSRRVEDVRFDDFDDSGLLPVYHRKELEDRFHGDIKGVEFDMFECTLEQAKRSSGNKGPTYSLVYHGVLFRFAFPKRFQGRTLGLKDAGVIGNFFKSSKVEGQRIKLEDPRFEKLFEVWGSDQVEARYLLTPTFMERIVELAKVMNSKRLEFCFINNLLLLSLHVRKNQFEGGGLLTDVTDKRRIEQLINEISRVFDIVDTLQLTLKTRA